MIPAMKPTVLIVGTLDTKGEEIAFLRDEIIKRECNCIIMDVATRGEPAIDVQIPNKMVNERGRRLISAQAGEKCDERGMAIEIVTKGGRAIVCEMLERKEFDGIISLGGGTGSVIGTTIMQALPIGVPKLQVSTLPGNLKDTRRYFGQKDMMMLNSMVDLVGLNSITRTLLEEAAGAITGMVKYKPGFGGMKRCVVITCLGVTTPGVMKVRKHLIERGKEVIVLHRKTIIVDELVSMGVVEAILDFTPNELVDGVISPEGVMNPNRLKSARISGIPLIVVPGAFDMYLCFSSEEDIPERLKGRPIGIHTEVVTLVGTTEQEQRRLGKFYGELLHEATGPAAVVIPKKGFSMRDREGSEFHNPGSIDGFTEEIKDAAPAAIKIVEADAHINEEAFAVAVINVFDDIMKEGA